MMGSARTAVVVEDDDDIRELITHSLTMQGFEVSAASSGQAGLELVVATDPDLVTLDLGLPDLDGIEVCRRVRDVSQAYVVMISARTDEIDRLMGLEIGADDYLTKPFSPRELQARVNAMFRRPRTVGATGSDESPAADANGSSSTAGGSPRDGATPDGATPELVRHGRIAVDPEGRVATVDDREVDLTRTEFDLLSTLVSAPRRVWSRAVLLDSLWGPGWSEEHLVEVHVGNLRRKLSRLGPDGMRAPIRTVRGVGYRMEEPDAF
ncbi:MULTISPECIES: response regulator transcription factor [unclassified Terrabacter]|uniref:response regulator transcription factor n=1 Tax=unclassified Terrabacter TaxID=2630222 RepID=UPI0007013D4F|nr:MULTISPECIES: response regulator transcription factor [unclassified Terrabacter]KRB48308.1 PhoR family transcriptional regulator [Terrabacter sp. Root181]KRF40813.1 PhoR family transcriptional regulator [Terrabacter sp. Soil810]